MSTMKEHINIRITGLVQGVSFRYYAEKKAQELGITGFVCNKTDGSVYCEAEGEQAKLNIFKEYMRIGPTLAKISSMDVTKGKMRNFRNFSIMSTSQS